jgi:hypothetical protein
MEGTMYDTRKYVVVERDTGELAISLPGLCDPNRRRRDMMVIRRSDGELAIVKRHRRRRHIRGKVVVNNLRGAFELNGTQLNFGITHTKITGELARLYYLHMLLNR